MKCDELQYERLGDANKTYPASTLVIRKQYVDAAITELKAKLESVQATAYAESVDAGMRERRLKRALWLARAERAKETQFLWQVYCHCDKLYFCKPFCVSTRKNPYRYISHMNVVEWDEFWGKIKNKCLAKAEEYK